MDHRVARLRTPEECVIVAKNALAMKRPDIALEARRRAVDIQVATHEAPTPPTPLEAETLAAIYASEAAMSHVKGKKVRATKSWQIVREKGLLQAAERGAANSEADHAALVELGLEDLSFDALILRHPESFSASAVEAATARATKRKKIQA
jgi:hypothetical protein